jgi:hypothetical protein
MMLGKAELKRGERNQGDLVCVGEESIETTAGEGGISILTLLSRLKYGAIEYSVTIERHQSSTTSSLQRVEIRGPGSFLIEWRN